MNDDEDLATRTMDMLDAMLGEGHVMGTDAMVERFGQDCVDYASAQGWISPTEDTIHSICQQVADWSKVTLRFDEPVIDGVPRTLQVRDDGRSVWLRTYQDPEELAYDLMIVMSHEGSRKVEGV